MPRLSRIQFRLVPDQTGAYGPDIKEGVDVLVDAVALRQIWLRETGEQTLPPRADWILWPGHSDWRDDPPLEQLSTEHGEGRRIVLVDLDGLPDCGGGSAAFQFGSSTVSWSDFRRANGEVVSIGPFEFDTEEYHQALKNLEQSWRGAK